MSNRSRLIVCALLLSAFSLPSVLADPISRYYLTAGQQNTNLEVQGAAIVNSWPQAYGDEYAIAISGEAIRTTSHNGGQSGGEYDLDGNYTGNNYPCPLDGIYDGTSDGAYNYTVQYTTGNVYRMDMDWQNPVLLFDLGQFAVGITYDASNDSLWVSTWDSTTVTNYTMGGGVLSSFSTAFIPTCLALDPADDTLWMGDWNDKTTFSQFSKAGTLLDSVSYPGLSSYVTLGGEMVPEPGTYVLLGLGLAGLALWRRSRKT